MPAIANAQVYNLPPPFKGQIDSIPTAVIESPYCVEMTNFNTENGVVSARIGDRYWSEAHVIGLNIITVRLKSVLGATDRLILATMDPSISVLRFSDVTTGTPSSMHTVASSSPHYLGVNEFGGCVFFFGGSAMAGEGHTRFVSPSTWLNDPYTFAEQNPTDGVTFKNRQYFWTKGSMTTYYSDVDAIGGATTVLNMAPVFSSGSGTGISIISPLQVSDVTVSQVMLAYVSSVGEVLIYSGSYPGGSDWTLSAKFLIPRPIGQNTCFQMAGDCIVITASGLVSLRELFSKMDGRAPSQGLTGPITNRWNQIVDAIPNTASNSEYDNVCGIWDYWRDRVIISFPVYVTRANISVKQTFFLIYDTKTGSWYEHHGADGKRPGTYPQIMGRDVFYSTYNRSSIDNYGTSVYKKEGSTEFRDDRDDDLYANYPCTIVSAPVPTPKTTNFRLMGLEVIMENDFAPYDSWSVRSDFGRSTSGVVKLSALPTGIQKPFISVGAEGTYLQWRYTFSFIFIEGYVFTIGCKIYGINVLYEQGGMR